MGEVVRGRRPRGRARHRQAFGPGALAGLARISERTTARSMLGAQCCGVNETCGARRAEAKTLRVLPCDQSPWYEPERCLSMDSARIAARTPCRPRATTRRTGVRFLVAGAGTAPVPGARLRSVLARESARDRAGRASARRSPRESNPRDRCAG